MPRFESPEISLVYDEAESRSALALAAALGLHPIPLDTITSAGLQDARAIIVDADLRDSGRALRLRRVLGGTALPLLFAIDRGARMHASRVQANALGANRLLLRPLRPATVRRVLAEMGLLAGAEPVRAGASVKAAARALDGAFNSLSSGVALDLDEAIGASRQLLSGVGHAGLESWLELVRGHHDGTFQHCLLVTGAAVAFAREAGLPEPQQLALTVAALLHDIGKAEIPLEILDKPGRLTEAEFAVIRRHPMIARDYLASHSSLPPEVVRAIAHHHEYLDGSGYPDGLAGDGIEPLTRILTVCDIYGALAERRAYKEPKSPHAAIMILADMARRGKVEYAIVRTLGRAVGVTLPEGKFHILGADSAA